MQNLAGRKKSMQVRIGFNVFSEPTETVTSLLLFPPPFFKD